MVTSADLNQHVKEEFHNILFRYQPYQLSSNLSLTFTFLLSFTTKAARLAGMRRHQVLLFVLAIACTEAQAASNITEVVLELPLLKATDGSEGLNTTFTFPRTGLMEQAPLILLLNGFNCESDDYSRVLLGLAELGYLSVVTDLRHRLHSQQLPTKPGCPNDTYLTPSAAVLDSVTAFIDGVLQSKTDRRINPPSDLVAALHNTNTSCIVLIGHSFGGAVATDILAGAEDGRLQGAILYEGYDPELALVIPEGKFVAYLAGTFNTAVAEAYSSSSGCKDYIQLAKANHFAITNYNPESKHQVAKCSIEQPHDDPHFTTNRQIQDSVNDLIGKLIHAEIQARVLHSAEYTAFLRTELTGQAMILNSTIDMSCLGFAIA